MFLFGSIYKGGKRIYLGVFESMVAVVFQNVFHLEMHQNNIFFIF
jgi:hypothetical protein